MSQPNAMRDERRGRRWSQSDLADRAGTWQERISLYENGREFPSPAVIARLAEAFEVEEHTIFRWLRSPAEEG